MDKNLIVSQLYALRAGLSVISQEKKFIDENFKDEKNNDAGKLKQLKSEQQEEWVDFKFRKQEAEDDVKSKERELDNCKIKYERTYAEATRSLGNARFKDFFGRLKEFFGIFLGVSALLIGFLLVAYGIFIVVCFETDISEGVRSFFEWSTTWLGGAASGCATLFIIVGIIILILGILGWVVEFFTDDFYEYTDRAKIIKSARYRLATERGQMNMAESNLQKALKNLENFSKEEEKISENQREDKKELITEIESGRDKLVETLKPRYNAAVVLYDGLDKLFGTVLDKRDWQNVDFLIFTLETGRADDLKEALQLVDRENQMQRLVQAINTANEQICRTINSGLANLQNNMRICFNNLAALMSQQNVAIMEGLYNISGQVASVSGQVANVSTSIGNLSVNMSNMSDYVKELSSATRLNQALLEESNKSSAQLAADVQRMRSNSDYADLMLRTGN